MTDQKDWQKDQEGNRQGGGTSQGGSHTGGRDATDRTSGQPSTGGSDYGSGSGSSGSGEHGTRWYSAAVEYVSQGPVRPRVCTCSCLQLRVGLARRLRVSTLGMFC